MVNTDTSRLPQLLALLSELDEFKELGRASASLAPERLSVLRRIATMRVSGLHAHRSRRLTDREVKRCWAANIKAFATRDEQEVAGYAESRRRCSIMGDIPLTSSPEATASHLLRYSEKTSRHRRYKSLPQ